MTVGDERRAKVQRAVDEWVRQLVDISGNNRLLYYKTLKQGTLELTTCSAAPKHELLAGNRVALSTLLPPSPTEPEATAHALKRARTIHRNALATFEEKGIDTLFLAVGMATWTADKSTATPAAPVLLRPVIIEPRGAAEAEFDLVLDGDWQVNETLLHLLTAEYRAVVDLDAIQESASLLDAGDGSSAAHILEEVERIGSGAPSFSIDPRMVIGTFAYQKLPMVKDLQGAVDALAEHDLIAALAGDDDARQSLLDRRAREVSSSLPDQTPPDDEFLILDADSSQSYVINAVTAGEPLIVQGPPGTGKSQTIANLIATSVARGRRVLFVAEKRAAIEAVTKRLRHQGLGGLVMDLHGGLGSKKQFAAALGDALSQIESAPPVDRRDLDRRLVAARSALLEHADSLHERREPWGLSIHEVESRLLALRSALPDGLRLTSSEVSDLGSEQVTAIRDTLLEWGDLAEPVASGRSPWSSATVTTAEEAERALGVVEDLASGAIPAARQALDSVLEDTGLPVPDSVLAWEQTLGVLRRMAEIVDRVEPDLYDVAGNIDSVLEPGRKGAGRRLVAQLFDGDYRRAKKTVRLLWRGDRKPNGSEAAEVVRGALEQVDAWTKLGGIGRPRLPGDLAGATTRYEALQDRLAALGAFLATTDPRSTRHDRVADEVRALADDQVTLFRLPRIRELEAALDRAHLEPLLALVRSGGISAEELGDAFDALWLTSIRQAVVPRDPRLAGFDGAHLDRRVDEYVEADIEHIESTAARVRRLAAEYAVAVCNRFPDQDALVRREANKKTRHIPTRRLFEQAPDVLTALRPCWTMSPLAVSQILPARPLFDLVVFDEASQILPADAVPALLRAPQAVVAGDRRQLPPTTFFANSTAEVDDEDLDETAAVSGYESILDVLDTTLGSRMLTWHYRSEDERLIGFSNHQIYDSSLTTFPGAADDDCLGHVMVRHRPGVPMETRSNPDEVDAVVELLVDHARTRPDQSLGVIAMGQYHAARIDAALRQRLAEDGDPDLDAFFEESNEERTFVKIIERVQGDERDAIILTVGYGKTPDGRLPYRFGPLLQDGGERRLNVAVTRARKRLTLVSSFSHADMDPERSSAKGVELLRLYLKYAESGGIDLDGADAKSPLNPFEIDVKHRIEQRGIRVIPQYGISGFRLDFALPHPSGEGFALAVEADGAAYHSSPTARDRDRLRQQLLEARGWRFHRIWSTDWFNDPEREADRVEAAFKKAVADRDADHRFESPHHEARMRAAASAASIGQPARSTSKPNLGPRRQVITEYRDEELRAIARWIRSDGLLRTRAQFVDEMADELGFRRGKRVVEAIERAIDATS